MTATRLESANTSIQKSDVLMDAELWKRFDIDLQPKAKDFHDGKIYAKLLIEPQSARELIEKFIVNIFSPITKDEQNRLYVDNIERGEFDKSFQDISVSGFNVKRQSKTVTLKIHAVPINNNRLTIKESNAHSFQFDGRIFGLSPIVHLESGEENYKFNIVVTWLHIGDRNAHKYLVYHNQKEIHCMNQNWINHEMRVFIHHIEPGSRHTLQIIAKLNNEKQTYKSDIISIDVPYKYESGKHDLEVLNILNEHMPWNFQGWIFNGEEQNKKILPKQHETQTKTKAKQLLEQLQIEIEEKKKAYEC